MALSKRELQEIIDQLKEQAQLQESISSSLEGYIDGVKKLKQLNDTINRTKKIEFDVQNKLQDAINKGNDKEADKQREILKILNSQTEELLKQRDVLRDNLKEVNKTNLILAKGAATLVKSVGSLPKLFDQTYSRIKGFGLFEMDKAMKKSALSMGLMTMQSSNLRFDIKTIVDETQQIGIGIEELSQLQSGYNEELGRSVSLNQSGLKALSDIAAATNLGIEGSAQIAANLEQQGYSAERTRDFIEQTVNDSAKLGLNATKVIKNVQQNIKLLNKYNFKGGVKGLSEMSKLTTKLGIDMNSITSAADKLFDIEGAVDMSAQLQVMGGAFAKLADPFKLMYMARNDIAGLTEEIGKAAEASVKFNKNTGEFEISALEMHRLRKIAEQTGIAYETLADAGKNARKQTEIRSQININVDKETQDYLSNVAKFTENGEAYIDIRGDRKLLKTLSNSDLSMLKRQVDERKTLDQMAKDARTFDDALNNTFKLMKKALLPLIESMNNNLIPKIDNFVNKLTKGGWLKKIETFAKIGGDLISSISGFILDNPIKSLITFFGSWALMKAVTWYAYGKSLGFGFNSVVGFGGKGGKGLGGGFSPLDLFGGGKSKYFKTGSKMMKSGRALRGASTITKGIGKTAAPIALLGTGMDAIENFNDETLNTGESLLKTLDQNKFLATGALIGSIFPGVGTAVGAGIGGLLDMLVGASGSYGVEDGFFPKTKNNFSDNRAIIQGGRITPIDNKDDLVAMKPGGVIDRNISKTSGTEIVRHEFGSLNINGEIILRSPNGDKIDVDLLRNPDFIRTLTQLINIEMKTIKNQVQV